MKSTTPYQDADVLQARLAARLVVGLGEQASALPHDLCERLRVAREQAVSRAREARSRAPAAAPVVVGSGGGAAVLAGPPAWWQRMAAVLPLVVLLGGLVFINDWTEREQLLAAADVDSVLLADDLPPAAYADPGFAEYLNSPQP